MSTELARRHEVARARQPIRVLSLRVLHPRRPGLREHCAYVHANWRNMTPAEAGEAGQRIGGLLRARGAKR
jgi:hypothetical protein